MTLYALLLLVGFILVAPGWGQTNVPATFPNPLPSNQLPHAVDALPEREGLAPVTAPGIPHTQDNQNAPIAMQMALLEAVNALDAVQLWDTPYSLPGAIGWLLDDGERGGPENAYSPEGEFGHSHRPQDGSMHLRLPPAISGIVVERGWGILHPFSADITGGLELNYLMIFGPRDEDELEVVWVIVQFAYAFARGLDLKPADSTAIAPASWGQTKAADTQAPR